MLLTDAVGGVEVCLNAPVNDEFSGANFPAGRQVLNGAQGVAFVKRADKIMQPCAVAGTVGLAQQGAEHG